LWLFWVLGRGEVLAVPRPSMRVEDDRLHCEEGPAVAWPGAARYWFWRGVQVPQKVIESPKLLTPEEISTETNVEVRRVMIERVGADRYLRDAGAELVQQDDYGKLWRLEFDDDEPLQMVEVVNSTPEPGGSRKTYFLRVPPRYKTARGAVAWTFGLKRHEYALEAES
jgi:hypothetical protein